MKQLLRSLMVCTMIFSAYALTAQTCAKGVWMIGGSAGFSSDKPDGGESTTSFELSPQLGYFIMDNLAIGALLSYQKSGDASTFGFGPMIRYYFANNLFGQVSYAIASYDSGLPNSDSVSGNELGIGIGYDWWLNNSIAIEPVLGYSKQGGDLGKGSSFGLSIGVQAFLGRE